MSEPTTLWEKCEHGRLVPHTVCTGEFGHDDACIHKGCPGGRERTFRLIGKQNAGNVWVEVSDE